MDIPAGIEAQAALTRQNIALSVIRNSAQQDKAVADILRQSLETIKASTTRGTNINTTA